MLRQEINLYQHFEPPKTAADFLSWKRYWLFNVIVVILSIIIFIFSAIENVYLKHKVDKQQLILAKYQSEFQKIKNTLPQLFFNKDINEAVKSMQNEVAAQKEIIAILARHIPFSEDLVGLSNMIVPNVWLSLISIQKNGDEITLKGDGIGIQNVHKFIGNMENDKIYKNYSIELNEIKNKDVNDPNVRLNFEIRMVRKSDE